MTETKKTKLDDLKEKNKKLEEMINRDSKEYQKKIKILEVQNASLNLQVRILEAKAMGVEVKF